MDNFGDIDGDGFIEYRRGAGQASPIKVGRILRLRVP
jgi:hypothetical protein